MKLEELLEEWDPPEEDWNSKGFRQERYTFSVATRTVLLLAKNSETEHPVAMLRLTLKGKTQKIGTPVQLEIDELHQMKTKILPDGVPMIGSWLAADKKYTPSLCEPSITITVTLNRMDITLIEETLAKSPTGELSALAKIRRDPDGDETNGYIQGIQFY